MSPDQRARALRLAEGLELHWGRAITMHNKEAANLLRELAAEPKCNPTLTECPRCGNRADMQDSHCVMRGGTVMGKPFVVENPSARRTEPEPRKRTEEDAFEDWLEKECPSGDVDEVQRKWEASEALAELLDEQRKQAEQDLLLDLLAVLHRDGGHHTDAVGLAQSIEDAKARYYALCDEPVRVPLTSERAIEIVYDEYGCERHGIDLVRAVERAHGITGDAK
jgi:hypothetical protein